VWYYRARVPNEIRRRIGPVWTGRGRPAEGYFTKKTAQGVLDDVLADARRGTLEGRARSTGVTFADASAEFLRFIENERDSKRSTVVGYRSTVKTFLDEAFGDKPVEGITADMIEEWRETIIEGRSHRTVNKILMTLHGVFERARKKKWITENPVEVEKLKEQDSGALDFYSPDEVHALVRAAADEEEGGSDQDAAIVLTAAFTGLRLGELLGLRVRDVDFGGETIRVERSWTYGEYTSPKSKKVRAVPMAEQVATALARLLQRDRFVGDDDLVFPNVAGDPIDPSAFRRRYKAAIKRAKLRPLRFHDLRHTFGSLVIDRASIVDVQAWMGHSDVKTTMRYLHYKSRPGQAAMLADAFRGEPAETIELVEEEAAT
jgi:integrase